MNRLERMMLIKMAVRDLDEAVAAYVPECGMCENWCSETSINRRIVTIRADLKRLEAELNRPLNDARRNAQ